MTTLIIHHWDADGVCSAALIASLLEYLGEDWQNAIPRIGFFKFDKVIFKKIEKVDDVFVVDLNVPDEIKKIDKKVTFIDHHIQDRIDKENVEYINPIVEGKSEKDYPSTTWIISDHFSIWNYLSVIGVLGDVGTIAFEWKIGKKMVELLRDAGLSKRDALKLTSLIDSNYIAMDKKCVEESVKALLESNPIDLLENELWLKNKSIVEKEIWKILSNIESLKDIAILKFKSDMNVISKASRRVVGAMGYKTVIAINKDFYGYSQVYLRTKSEEIDIPIIIRELRNRGFNAGGKRDVLGVMCQKRDLDNVLSVIMSMLNIG